MAKPGCRLTEAALSHFVADTKRANGFNQPWPMLLWDVLSSLNQNPTTLSVFLTLKHNYKPVRITGFKMLNLTAFFPWELSKKYFALPFSVTGSLLSVAVIDPDTVPAISDDLAKLWASKKKPEGNTAFAPFYPAVLELWVVQPPLFQSYFTQLTRQIEYESERAVFL
jgi:hypothetical protein